ncbi:MAG TPA: ABC transporter permease [Beutenbergiaceae bacterium]|nr:ABC transporter permease [Beutenbergiaceae bacterium]
MNLVADAIAWMFSDNPYAGGASIPWAIAQHLGYTAISVFVASLVAVPLGWWIGHTGKGKDIVVALSGAGRAIPSFGLLVLLVLVIGVTRKPSAAILTYALLAFAAILSGAYSGVASIPRDVVDASRAMGMTEWQILFRTEVPLSLPLLVAGIRSAVLQVVATVTIGAYVGLGGLGQYIIAGIPLRRFDMVLGGAILVTLLALVLDGVFALAQRGAAPQGLTPQKVNH